MEVPVVLPPSGLFPWGEDPPLLLGARIPARPVFLRQGGGETGSGPPGMRKWVSLASNIPTPVAPEGSRLSGPLGRCSPRSSNAQRARKEPAGAWPDNLIAAGVPRPVSHGARCLCRLPRLGTSTPVGPAPPRSGHTRHGAPLKSLGHGAPGWVTSAGGSLGVGGGVLSGAAGGAAAGFL